MQLLDMGTRDDKLLKTFYYSNNKIQMAEIRTPNIEFLKQTIARHGIRPHEF